MTGGHAEISTGGNSFPLFTPLFWLAMLLGVMVSYLLARAMGHVDASIWSAKQWQQLLWLVLIYPFVEEWLFRGMIQARLWQTSTYQRALLGFSLANLFSSCLFVLGHLYSHSLLWAGVVFFPSLVFGWFRDRYQGILPGYLLHVAYNFSYFYFSGLPAINSG